MSSVSQSLPASHIRGIRSCGRLLGIGCVVGLAGCVTPVTPDPEPAVPAVALSTDEREFARALAYYAEGLIREQLRGRGDPGALDAFSNATSLDPDSRRLLSRTAVVALQQEKPGVAISLLEDACREHPDDVQARIDLAAVYHISGSLDDAVRCYRQALRMNPDHPGLALTLAGILLRQKRDDEAVKVLYAGADRPGQLASLLSFAFNSARLLVEDNQANRAVPLFRFMAERAPAERVRFYCLLGELYEQLGRTNDALGCLESAIAQDPSLPEAYVQLANLQFDVPGKKDDARKTLEKGVARYPDAPPVLFGLAYLYHAEGRNADAIPLLEHIRSRVNAEDGEKLSSGYYLLSGSIFERLGRVAEAETVFREGISLYPDEHQILNYLAYMWADKNMRLDEGLDFVQRALQIEPANGAYIDTLGWIYFRQGRLDDALREIEKARQAMPDDPTIHEHMGDILQAKGDLPRAIEAWSASFRLDPDNPTVRSKLEAAGVDVRHLPRTPPAGQAPPDTQTR